MFDMPSVGWVGLLLVAGGCGGGETSRAASPRAIAVRGRFDSTVVAERIRHDRVALQACYESELRRDPSLEGRVVITLTIHPSGAVSNVHAVEDSMNSRAVARCLVQCIGAWRFTPGPEGGPVRFTFPLVFESSCRAFACSTQNVTEPQQFHALTAGGHVLRHAGDAAPRP